jgi:hypothetical protein
MLHAQGTNGFPEEQYKVIYKRPSDLAIKSDVPVCCNILVCDMPDEGDVCSSRCTHSRGLKPQARLTSSFAAGLRQAHCAH